jgi:hypothetical protein
MLPARFRLGPWSPDWTRTTEHTSMQPVDLKQVPNLEQVFTISLVPLLLAFIALSVLLGLLWGKTLFLQRRIATIEQDLKAMRDLLRKTEG